MKVFRRIAGVVLSVTLLGTSFGLPGTGTVQAAEDLGEIRVFLTQQYGTWYEEQQALHFSKTSNWQQGDIIRVYPDSEGQTFLGIGGAMTESAAYNLSKLSYAEQERVLEAYYGDSGARFSLVRSAIGSPDFATRSYSYCDTEEPDPELINFSIAKDYDYVIPYLKRVKAYRPDALHFAAPWAPPAWMKKSGVRRGQTGTAALNLIDNSLKPEYYQSYANYFLKYLQAYEREGLPIYALSVQNEAQNNPKWEACTWTSSAMAEFIGYYLGPTLERGGYGGVEINIWDWDKGNDSMHGEGFINFNKRVLSNPVAQQYVGGIAFHWYAGDLWHEAAGTPMWSEDFYSLDSLRQAYPDVKLHATEACQEKGPWFNSFAPADRYIYDILNDFEHGVDCWIDWNLVLDKDGGPTQGVVNQCHAPVMLDEYNRVCFQPSYYIFKQISREIQPGTVHIDSTSTTDTIVKTAAKDKDGNVSLLIGNVKDYDQRVTVIDGERSVTLTVPSHGLMTLKYNTAYNADTKPVYDPTRAKEWVIPVNAYASSHEWGIRDRFRPYSAIDRNSSTRWASGWNNGEWIVFELSADCIVTGVDLNFECGADAHFVVEVSEDGYNYTQVLDIPRRYFRSSNRDVCTSVTPTYGRYVRMRGIERNNRYGYSIYEAMVEVQQN